MKSKYISHLGGFSLPPGGHASGYWVLDTRGRAGGRQDPSMIITAATASKATSLISTTAMMVSGKWAKDGCMLGEEGC